MTAAPLALALLLLAAAPSPGLAAEPAKPAAPAKAAATTTIEAIYRNCQFSAGSAKLFFRDAQGKEIVASVMTKAQRTGMAPDEPYVKFPEEMIKVRSSSGSDANPAYVGKRFLLVFDAEGDVKEIRLKK
ncbi:MAG: hypothetical protein JSR82_08845 [Verrucomicrobia bacterium]|nr:hypothetical protein [Verrucomicrobiota bacterium]